MQKHLPTIIVSVATLVLLACLHLFVFAPMHREYAQATEGLRGGVEKLKGQINEVDWNIPKPDPRDPQFTWDGLLTNVKGNYDGKLAAYQNLVEDIDISLPADEPEKSKELVLTRLKNLQELERQNGRRLRVADKWGVNTWSDMGHNGTRPLDLTLGGYVSYAGEGRIDGKQGTISFAINVTPWAEISEEMPKTAEEISKRQAEGPQTQVLFHAGRVKPPEENAPKGAPTEYSSEIMVQREGYSLNFIFKKFDLMDPIAKSTPLSIGDWFDKKTMGNPWKVIRFSWGPTISDMQIFVDGKSATEFNMTARQPMAGGGMPGGMGMMGMGMMGMGMMGMNMMGGREGYGGGMTDPNKGVSLEAFDAFTIGCDLQYKNTSALMFDSFRIWNTLAKSGEPQSEPLFQEDFEAPFGSDTELKRSIEQMTRFLRESYDPQNEADVKKSNKTWYEYMNGFWGISPGLKDAIPEWISTMKTLAFLDHAAKVATKSGDPERLAREINITIPEHTSRRHVATFLDLAVELANQLLTSQVDSVYQIDFLTWSNTVNDEPLKAAYKEAFDTLEADVGAAGGMMKGSMGMMGMGMMGMGMMGGGMYGGMAGMGPPGMMGPGMMPGMYGPPGMYGGVPGGDEEASNPEALRAAEEERNNRMKEMQEQMEAQFKKMQEYESNREKWQRWVKFNKKNEIPPEFYTDYQSQMSQKGKDFFLRYSLQTTFECSKDRLAPTLHAIEFGKRLAFISKVRLSPVPETTSQIKAIVNVEYNFMMAQLLQEDVEEETPAEGTEPPAEGEVTEEVQTSDTGGAG